MFTAVERGAPAAKMPKKMSPDKAKKAAKSAAKEVPGLVDAATEARAALEAKLREVADARRAADGEAPGVDPETMRAYWVLRYGDGGSDLPDLTSRYMSDVRVHVELPPTAVRDVADYLGRGIDDGQLVELRERERRIEARKLVLRALTAATVAGEKLTAKQLAARAINLTIPPDRRAPERRSVAASWLASRSRDALV